MQNKNILSLYSKLCKPFYNGEKTNLILELLKKNNIHYEYSNDIGIFIPAKNKMSKVIVSHIDLISLFDKGFLKNKSFIEHEEVLIGALDNTITNAILLLSMIEKIDENSGYLFTLDEETSQNCMKNFMKINGTDFFVINLDVTNEGFNGRDFLAHSSVEYDYPSIDIVNQIIPELKRIQKKEIIFTTQRFCDDLDQVINASGFGFSYCLPTGNKIHSYSNFCKKDSLVPYLDGLNFLIHELDISKFKNIESK